MSWGALNNHNPRKASEPLPDFLTDRGGREYSERLEPQAQNDDVVIHRAERPYVTRQDSLKGYGVSYSGAIDIRLTKKTLFVSVMFFVMAVLMAFCAGYVSGNLSIDKAVAEVANALPVKKPIIPSRKKNRQPLPPLVERANALEESPTFKEDALAPNGSVAPEALSNAPALSKEKNNKDDDDSEPVYKEAQAAENSDMVD